MKTIQTTGRQTHRHHQRLAERRKPGQTPETIRRRNLSEAMKLRHARCPLSPEARQRIAEGQKRRWAAWKAGQTA